MEHIISIYDIVNKIDFSFNDIKSARETLNVSSRDLSYLRNGKSNNIWGRFILSSKKHLLTVIEDSDSKRSFEILDIRTLGLILDFAPTKRDAAALCLIKGSRANFATINGRRYINPNADKDKINLFLQKVASTINKNKVKEHRARTFYARRERKKKWNQENKEKVRKYNNAYTTQRRKTDVSFRMRMNLRSRIKLALNGETKKGSILILIGCPMDFLKKHIQDQFCHEMSWENYGSFWVIDHIIPCSFFDLSIEDHQRMCCYYKNLRPLCKIENGKKLNHLPNNYRSFITDNLIERALSPVTAYKLMLAGHANL